MCAGRNTRSPTKSGKREPRRGHEPRGALARGRRPRGRTRRGRRGLAGARCGTLLSWLRRRRAFAWFESSNSPRDCCSPSVPIVMTDRISLLLSISSTSTTQSRPCATSWRASARLKIEGEYPPPVMRTHFAMLGVTHGGVAAQRLLATARRMPIPDLSVGCHPRLGDEPKPADTSVVNASFPARRMTHGWHWSPRLPGKTLRCP